MLIYCYDHGERKEEVLAIVRECPGRPRLFSRYDGSNPIFGRPISDLFDAILEHAPQEAIGDVAVRLAQAVPTAREQRIMELEQAWYAIRNFVVDACFCMFRDVGARLREVVEPPACPSRFGELSQWWLYHKVQELRELTERLQEMLQNFARLKVMSPQDQEQYLRFTNRSAEDLSDAAVLYRTALRMASAVSPRTYSRVESELRTYAVHTLEHLEQFTVLRV